MALQAGDAGAQGTGTRVLSALVLTPIALALAYAGGITFNLLVLSAAALMAYEWYRLCNDGAAATSAGFAVLTVAPVAAMALGRGDLAVATVLPAAALALALARLSGDRRLWAAAGVAYISLPCIAVVWLRAEPTLGFETVLWLFAVVWATDIGAYFAGRTVGGPKLAPRVSPGKTWAGLVGGTVCAGLAGAGAAVLLDLSAGGPLVLFSAALALVAQAGDLWESWVKRRFGKKDSGRLIPGHGGALDRLDGLMAAAPVVAAAALVSGEGVLAWR